MNHWNDNLQHSVFVDTSKRKAVYAGGEGYLEHNTNGSISKKTTKLRSNEYTFWDVIDTGTTNIKEATDLVRRNIAEKEFRNKPDAKILKYIHVRLSNGKPKDPNETQWTFVYEMNPMTKKISVSYWRS